MCILLEGLFFAPSEWLLILVIVLLLFGGKKIPELMKGLGSGIKNFKDGMKGEENESKPDKIQGKTNDDNHSTGN